MHLEVGNVTHLGLEKPGDSQVDEVTDISVVYSRNDHRKRRSQEIQVELFVSMSNDDISQFNLWSKEKTYF